MKSDKRVEAMLKHLGRLAVIGVCAAIVLEGGYLLGGNTGGSYALLALFVLSWIWWLWKFITD